MYAEDKVWLFLVTLFGLLTLGFVSFALLQVMTQSGQIDYCYTDTAYCNNDSVGLKGHRPWSGDARFGCFKSADEAAAYAEKIHCPILSK